KLPINFLQYLTKLEYLDISTNDFEILNQQFPKNLNTLKTLKMDSLNKLKIIKCNIFNKMELLEEIDIAHSNISQLDNCIFNGLTQLKINKNQLPNDMGTSVHSNPVLVQFDFKIDAITKSSATNHNYDPKLSDDVQTVLIGLQRRGLTNADKPILKIYDEEVKKSLFLSSNTHL
ncbi:unnamed protein product, partial [Didymodactylos carnosus]